MRKLFYLLFFIATLLYGQSEKAGSKIVVENESLEVDHESSYGVTNSYSLLVAEHQLQADRDLLFYYGTKIGFVAEEYTAENGFGPDTESIGTVLEANIGLNYSLEDLKHITLEGNRIQDALHQESENRFKIGYQYRF